VGTTAQTQKLDATNTLIPERTWTAGSVSANTVALFACQSSDLAQDYAMTNFLGMNSGPDRVTDLQTLGSAALSFILADALARPGADAPPNTFIGPLDPLASANSAILASPKTMDQGDSVIQFPRKEEQK
jgi:hypothetical protein